VIALRQGAEGIQSAHNHSPERRLPLGQALHLQPGMGQKVGQVRRRKNDLNVIFQPLQTDLHKISSNKPLRLSKLLEKLNVVLIEQANVIEPDPEHGNSLHAQAEGIAGVNLGVIPDEPENLRVDHS
jgi:hypothetical protein